MKDKDVKLYNIDLFGQAIFAGDWIVLASSSSNEQPFRFGYVSKLNKDGKPLYLSFKMHDQDMTWYAPNSRAVAASAAHKSWKISGDHLPSGLKLFIYEVLGGDPFNAYRRNGK